MVAQSEFRSLPELYPAGLGTSVVPAACMMTVAVVAVVDCSTVAGPADSNHSCSADYNVGASVAVDIAFLPCYFDSCSAWSLDSAAEWVVHMVGQDKSHSAAVAAVNKDCYSSHTAGVSSCPSDQLDSPASCPEPEPCYRGS